MLHNGTRAIDRPFPMITNTCRAPIPINLLKSPPGMEKNDFRNRRQSPGHMIVDTTIRNDVLASILYTAQSSTGDSPYHSHHERNRPLSLQKGNRPSGSQNSPPETPDTSPPSTQPNCPLPPRKHTINTSSAPSPNSQTHSSHPPND